MARLLVVWNTTSNAADNLGLLVYETTKGRPAHHPAPGVWIVDANHTPESLLAYLSKWRGYQGQVLVLDLVTHQHASVGRSALDEHLLEEVLGQGIKPAVDDGSKFGYGLGPEKPKHDPMWYIRHK